MLAKIQTSPAVETPMPAMNQLAQMLRSGNVEDALDLIRTIQTPPTLTAEPTHSRVNAVGDVTVIDGLIEVHRAALAEHDRVFTLSDQGQASETEVIAALAPIDDALVALCAARPTSSEGKLRRREYLSARLTDACRGCEGLTKAVFEALLSDGMEIGVESGGGYAPSKLDDLITAHIQALAAYDAEGDDYDKENDITGRAADETRDALLAHRPVTLEEVRLKADFMAKTRTFTEWDYFDKVKLIEALTPALAATLPTLEPERSALADLIAAHKAAYAAFCATINPADEIWCKNNGVKVTKAAKLRWERANRAEERATMAICRYRPATDSESRMKANYLLKFDGTRSGFTELSEGQQRAILLSMKGGTAHSKVLATGRRGPATAAPSPIMALFQKWNALRDAADAKSAEEGDEADVEFLRLMNECDDVMAQISALPPTDARDFAAKLSCITHYGSYEELGGDKWGVGSAIVREAAELAGHPEHVADYHRVKNG